MTEGTDLHHLHTGRVIENLNIDVSSYPEVREYGRGNVVAAHAVVPKTCR